MKQVRALAIEGDIPPCDRIWQVRSGEKLIGQVTSAAKSPDFGTNVAIGMVRMTHWDEGTQVDVHTQNGVFKATVHEKFWL